MTLIEKRLIPQDLSASQLLLAALVTLFPVVHSTLLYRSYQTPQLALIILSLACVTGLAAMGSIGWLRHERVGVRATVLMAALALGWMTVSAIFGMDPVRSLTGHSFQSNGLVVWYGSFALFLLALRHRGSLPPVVEGATLLSWGILLAFLAMWFAHREVVQEFLVPVNGDGVPLPGIGHSAFLGAFAAAGASIAGGRWMRTAAPLWLGLAGTLTAYLVVTQARVSVALFAVAIVGAAFLAAGSRAERLRMAGLVGVVLVSGLASQVWLVPRLTPPEAGPAEQVNKEDAPEVTSGRFAGNQIATGVQVRLQMWQVAVKAIADRPWLGSGPGNFSYVFREQLEPGDAVSIPPDLEVADAHNILIEVASTSGVVPAALLAGASFALALSWARSGRMPGVLWVRLSVLMLLSPFLVQPVSQALLPLLAIFAAVGTPPGDPLPTAEGKPAKAIVRKAVASLAVVAGVLVSGAMVWSDALLASGALHWDQQALTRAAKLDPTCQTCLYHLGEVRSWDFKKESRGSFNHSISPLEKAAARHPRDSEAHLRLGTGLMFLGHPGEALEPLGKARKLHPTSPRIAVALGAAHLQSGDPKDALDHLLHAISIDPTPLAWELVAEAHRQLGRSADARSAMEEADRLRSKV